MDAQTLFRDGVLALRDQQDVAQARRLLMESLKLDPKNEMAWLWLSRTTEDPQKKLQCVERALRLNPNNQQAQALRQKLTVPAANRPEVPLPAPLDELREAASAPAPKRYDAQDEADIDMLLGQADQRLKADDAEGAIEFWVRVLDIQPDQPVAIQNAVQQLYKLGYQDDAAELLQRAIDRGTTSIPIFLTAIDLARAAGEPGKADSLREQAAALPTADEALVLKTVDYFIDGSQYIRAIELLDRALASHPDNTALLLRMAELQEQTTGDKAKARVYYERVARSRNAGKHSQTAEKALTNYTPVISDRERGSVGLAVREAVGFGVIFVLLGWQDAGLDLMRLGAQRWLGVALSIIGGYLLVTGLSSPQQKPLAAWLGGKVPPPEKVTDDDAESPTSLPILPGVLRGMFALVGGIVLAGAFLLVFSTSIGLLRHPVPPFVPSIFDLVSAP